MSSNISRSLFCMIMVSMTMFFGIQNGVSQTIKNIRTADKLYKLRNYSEAYNIYYRLHEYGNLDAREYEKLGICAFQINKIKDCIKYLKKTPKANTNTDFYLGNAYHLLNKSDSAALFYKRALSHKSVSQETQDRIVLRLQQCQSLNWRKYEDKADVTQQEVLVNSVENELSPLFDPSNDDRLLFSSSFDALAVSTSFNSPLNHDVKIVRYWDGNWVESKKITSKVSTNANERPICFLSGGKSLLYVSDKTLDNKLYLLDVKMDTISECNDFPFFDLSQGDNDLYVWEDKIAVFVSSRYETYGGLDVFISYRDNGEWTAPKNLGSSVNSSYDEVSPFYEKGMLYFSSDRPSSIGGFDVFTSTLEGDDFLEAKPLPAPINSPANDIFFKTNGPLQILSSDRVSSVGKYDVLVFKKNKAKKAELPLHKAFENSEKVRLEKIVKKATQVRDSIVTASKSKPQKSITLNALFYNENGDLLTESNMQKLNLLVSFLKYNPEMIVGVLGFDHPRKRKKELAFLQVKKILKSLRLYLMEQGVNPNQLYFMNAGGQYPYGSQEIEKKIRGVLPQYNRRVEFVTFMPAEKNLLTNYELGGLTGDEVSNDYKFFRSQVHGFTFSVEVIPQEKNIFDKSLFKFNDVSLYLDENNDAQWMMHLGYFDSPTDAKKLAQRIKRKFGLKTNVVAKSYGRLLDKTMTLYYAREDVMLQKWLLNNE